MSNLYIDDYIQGLYNVNNRMNKDYLKKKYNEEKNWRIYEEEKKEKIMFFENDSNSDYENQNECENNKIINFKIWEYKLWDICFASSYGFPKNKMGFRGQWYLPKLRPFVNYLKNISHIENIHICYKKISETDDLTLETLFYYNKPYECNCKYNQKRCEYCNYLEKEMYLNRLKVNNNINIINKITWKEYNNFIFEDFEYKFDTIEDIHNFRIQKLHLVQNKKKDIINVLNLLEEHFLCGYSFFTFYLPENIKEFEDYVVIKDDGNFCEIIARSKEYFYYFQQTN
jgi:hypothetical protein